MIGRELVYSVWYGRWQEIEENRIFCSKGQYRRFLVGGGVDEMHGRYVFKHWLININDFYLRLRLQLSWFDKDLTPPPNFFDATSNFSFNWGGGGVKKVQIKKPEHRAKCTSALAWSVNFKFFSNPNVWNGTSWSLTTLSKKIELGQIQKIFQPKCLKRD